MKVLIALGIAAVVMLAMVFLAVILFVAAVAVDIASNLWTKKYNRITGGNNMRKIIAVMSPKGGIGKRRHPIQSPICWARSRERECLC